MIPLVLLLSSSFCGMYTSVCYNALAEAGLHPLDTDEKTGLAWIDVLGRVLYCESRYKHDALNEENNTPAGSRDRGIAQINDHWHSNVTDKQAFDPVFSIKYVARHFAEGKAGLWTCYKGIR